MIVLSREAEQGAVKRTRSMGWAGGLWTTFEPTDVEGSREVRLAAFRRVRDSLAVRIKERFGAPRAPVV